MLALLFALDYRNIVIMQFTCVKIIMKKRKIKKWGNGRVWMIPSDRKVLHLNKKSIKMLSAIIFGRIRENLKI